MFAHYCLQSNDSARSAETLVQYAQLVNNRMPVLSKVAAEALIITYTAHGANSLAASPISKAEAPLLKTHVDGAAYSRSEPPKNHSLPQRARNHLDQLV